MRFLELVSMRVMNYWLPCLDGMENEPHMSVAAECFARIVSVLLSTVAGGVEFLFRTACACDSGGVSARSLRSFGMSFRFRHLL